MSDWFIIFAITLMAGLGMVLGALIASVEKISNYWLENELRHTIIAFGGGILISAVALVLIPEGMLNISPVSVVFCFGLGGIFFMYMDILLSRFKAEFPQLISMLLDFVPEVTALGAIFLLNKPYAILLGILILLQNIPEGFNAYQELRNISKLNGKSIIFAFFLMSLLGPIAGLTGYFFLSEYQSVVSGIMLFAAGGILYLIFQDIAPQAKLRNHWAPSFGAILGFIFGMIGKMLVI